MSRVSSTAGVAPINGAQISYEVAGAGRPFVMIHAGVADSRQWNNEFAYFARQFRVVRFDMRGYGSSEPVAGEFSHLNDLTALLDYLGVDEPAIVMGCSMGGGVAMDFALTRQSKVVALIMVGSAPTGLKLDTPTSAKFADAERAEAAGDLDLLCEIETQIWFDGTGRTSAQVNQAMRKLVYEMNRKALLHESKHLGKRLPDTDVPAVKRLAELHVPTLVIVGAHDTAYLLAASDYLVKNVSSARKVLMDDAAHLPNLDQPDVFQRIVSTFLSEVD